MAQALKGVIAVAKDTLGHKAPVCEQLLVLGKDVHHSHAEAAAHVLGLELLPAQVDCPSTQGE